MNAYWTVGRIAGAQDRPRRSAPREVRVGLGAEAATAYEDVSESRLRHVMSGFGTGVTVVTGATAEGPAGFTCQTFTSLSLTPPLITVNPARDSTSWPRIRATGRFCVNVLGAGHEHLARSFSRPAGTAAGSAARFEGVGHTPTPLGSPRLDEALAWVDCRIEAEHDGGDHTIVVGRVIGTGTASGEPPLLYFRGGYGTFEPR
ncbi:flavin reductase family protein [Brevibacterium album]|uniref:flavin reductase family protein n=1 Tax=Brevibacterium album TaxID=417948 RepID=UPI000418159E|nr:flavin reductase family protein [Brevibacterium album]